MGGPERLPGAELLSMGDRGTAAACGGGNGGLHAHVLSDCCPQGLFKGTAAERVRVRVRVHAHARAFCPAFERVGSCYSPASC